MHFSPLPFLRLVPYVAALAILGCSQAQEFGDRSAPSSASGSAELVEEEGGGSGMGDVMLEGVSILGAWSATAILGDAQATRDLETGAMEMMLIIQPNGRSTLTGEDRREGSGRVSFAGIIEGNRISFDGMDGYGSLSMSGRELILRDPRGRSTRYRRVGG